MGSTPTSSTIFKLKTATIVAVFYHIRFQFPTDELFEVKSVIREQIMGRRKMDSELHRIKLETGTVYQTSKGGNYYFRYQINGER